MGKKLSEISKFLSFVLRHRPDAIGVTLDLEASKPCACMNKASNSIRLKTAFG